MRDWTSTEIAEMGYRLRSARIAAGFLRATEAVRTFGWTYSRYMNYENGERAIPPKQAALFSLAYRISVDYIYFGENKLTEQQHLHAMIAFEVRKISLVALNNIAELERITSGLEPMVSVTIPVAAHDNRLTRCLFIEVADRSMSNIKEPVSFDIGDKVLIDIDAVPAPSDFVLALVPSEKTSLFRRYREVELARCGLMIIDLVPLNANFRTVRLSRDNPGAIIGVCRQLHRIRDL